VLISIDPGFRIQGDPAARLDDMMKNIRTAFCSIFFDGVTNNLTFARASTGPIVIPDPAPIEIPGHLYPNLRIREMHVGKRKPGDVVQKVSIRSQTSLTSVSASGHAVFFRNSR